MPKRIGNLLPVMTDRNFIKGVMFEHAKKRMDDPTTVPALLHADECVAQVQHWIICGDWVPSKPIHTRHYEPSNGKLRDIDYVPFWPDGVMHWILIDSIYDKVVPKLDPYCVAGIRGRGPHSTKKHVEYWIKTDRAGTKYGAELDIHHNFPETDHDFVMYGYRQLIKDKYWLRLADAVVQSFANGLPIGYVTSHWFQNLAMTAFDRYVRSLDGVQHYYRYVDNIHMYGPNKRKLHRALQAAMDWLCAAGYTINSSWQVYRTDYIDADGEHRGRALDGLGFVIYCDHTTYRKRTSKRLIRLCLDISKRPHGTPTPHQARQAACRIGQLKHADMHHFRVKHVDGVISYRKIREAIQNA